jgi:hypothetical protein
MFNEHGIDEAEKEAAIERIVTLLPRFPASYVVDLAARIETRSTILAHPEPRLRVRAAPGDDGEPIRRPPRSHARG